jgi:hypothetical protein
MEEATTEKVFRVTVRGRFADLTHDARRFLVAAQSEHDIFVSAYTAEGTLTSTLASISSTFATRFAAPTNPAPVPRRSDSKRRPAFYER